MSTVLTRRAKVDKDDNSSERSSLDGDQSHVRLLDVTKVDDSLLSLSAADPTLGVPRNEKRFWFQRAQDFDPNEVATQPSVYDDPETAKDYKPREDWENLHRFDPSARWTWGEENKLVRKIDYKITIFACIMFMALELDRANISQANTDNFLNDLGLTTNDYNLGNTIFKFAFLCAELPSQLVSKWVGPDVFIPTQMVAWSIVASCQFKLNGKSSFLACRALLGLIQGGFIPDIVLYLSYFYKHHELSIRLGFFWTAMGLADIASAFLGFGILHMGGVGGKAGWRWLFLIEGLITLVVGLLAFVLMPASPTGTASWFRGKDGWFTEREEIIMVNRVIRDDPSKGDMHNRQPISPKLLWQSLTDYDLWPLYIVGLLFEVPYTPHLNYLTLNLKDLGFGTFSTNLLTIPYRVLGLMILLLITYLSEIWQELAFTSMSSQIWCLPFMIYFVVVDTSQVNKWTIWFITTLLLAVPYVHPIQVSWNSRNSNSVATRSVSASIYNMCVQSGGIISANIYRADDAPRYVRGNKVLLCICLANICLYAGIKAYYVWRNKEKGRKWSALSEDEKLEYLATTTDEGNRRLDFRFAH